MEDSVSRLAAELRVPYLSKLEAEKIVDRIYAIGYKSGVYDQKKINMRIKYRYKLLLDWVDDQLTMFSIYTRRSEYKDIIDLMTKIISQYKTDNNLFSTYRPATRTVDVDVDGEVVSVELDMKKELSNLLKDIMTTFINEEDKKEEAKREKLNQKKENE